MQVLVGDTLTLDALTHVRLQDRYFHRMWLKADTQKARVALSATHPGA